jgi:N-acetyl-gamma-glutamyl-phosphate reductase
MTDPIKVGILGASGYTGADLVRLLIEHPSVEICLLSAERSAGKPIGSVFPHLIGFDLPELVSAHSINWADSNLDVVFCALPHATSQEIINKIMTHDNAPKVIDLSADFRLRDVKTYAKWYGGEHQAVDLQKEAVYGLSEIYRSEIEEAKLVACPGCYPTAALLALIPLLQTGLISPENIIIDAKSGTSGAGRSLKEANLFVEVSEAIHPYAIGQHRHMPEIEQELSFVSDSDITISFTPHLVPMNRGELETIYIKLNDSSLNDIKDCWNQRYGADDFIQILEDGTIPATRMVRGSNRAVMNVFADRRDGHAIIVVAIDNLVKGSSGQAIQNMNIMFGLEENLGLTQVAMFP